MIFGSVFLHGKSVRKDGSFDSMWTKEVTEIKESLLPHHINNLSYTASGYGSKIPTRYMIKFNGRWRRVYARCYSNAATCYITAPKGEEITVQL